MSLIVSVTRSSGRFVLCLLSCGHEKWCAWIENPQAHMRVECGHCAKPVVASPNPAA